MHQAAVSGASYHLWWHPHNFGNYPGQCMNELHEIINYFLLLKEKYNMLSMNMGELTEYIKRSKKA